MTPIIVICKDRVRYLDTTLASITATVPEDVPVYLANDGCETDRMLRYLTTDDMVSLEDELRYPNENPVWIKHVGFLPNHDQVRGVLGKVKVFINRGGRTLGKILQRAMADNPGAKRFIRIEDDVVMREGWYQEMCGVTGERVGIISGMLYFRSGTQQLKRLNDRFQVVITGTTGGQIMSISKKLCMRCPRVFSRKSVKHTDKLWVKWCRQNDMLFCVPYKSMCQHFGVVSEWWLDSERTFMDESSFSRGIDDISPPFALADEVGHFGRCK